MNTTILFMLFLALSFLAGPSLAVTPAAETAIRNPPTGHRTIKTIIVESYPPYTFVNEEGEPDGFSVDLLRAVAREMGMDVEFRVAAWDQAKRELEQGSINLLPMMAYSAERDRVFDFSLPHTIAYDALFLRKENSNFRTLGDLAGKTVFVMNRDAAHEFLVSSGLSKKMTLTPVGSLPEGLKRLAAGEGDAAVMPKLVGIVALNKLGQTNIIASPELIDAYSRPFCFAVKEGDLALQERLNHGLRIVKSTGQYDTIYAKWFSHLEDPHIKRKTVLKYAFAMMLVLLVFLAWSFSLRRQVARRTLHLEQEITRRMNAEQALKEHSQRLKLATESADLGVWDWDIARSTMTWDDRMLELYGITRESFPGGVAAWHNGLHPADRAATIEECQAALRGEKDWNTTFRVMHPDGTVLYIKATGIVIRNSEGTPVRMLGINQDITSLKKNEALLKKNDARMQCLVRVSQHNAKNSADLLNYALDEAITLTGSAIGYFYFYDEAAETFTLNSWSNGVMENCSVVEKQTTYLLEKTGAWGEAVRQRRPVIINNFAAPHPYKKGLPHGHVRIDKFITVPIFSQGRIVAVIGLANKSEDYDNTDIVQLSLLMENVWKTVQRLQSEEKLIESRERYFLTLDAVNDGIWDWHIPSGSAFFSPNYYGILGYEDGEFIASYDSWRALVHPEDLERVENELQSSIATSRGFVIDLRMKMKSGAWLWVMTRGKVVEQDARGTALRSVGTLSDISGRKLSETELQDKNAELERFIYTVSHDLRSPLVTIKAFLGFMQDDLKDNESEKVARDLDYISGAADKMDILLKELLEMSRIGKVGHNPVRISYREILDDATASVAGRIEETKTELHMQEDDIVLLGDRQRLSEIWQNLIENAVKYMGGQPAPRVELGTERAGSDMVFFVRDNGMGIDPCYHDKIFNLFEKLNPKSEGTGLGLALVKRIVTLYNGRIWVESDGPGTGSCFKFTLPNAETAIRDSIVNGPYDGSRT